MESIELIGYPFKVSNSSVYNCSFVTFATPIGVIDVKINCILENYKYAKYIDYCHLCKFFIVKSRQNWILKDFIKAEKIFLPKRYDDYLLLTDIIRLFQRNFKKIDENFLPLINQVTSDFNDSKSLLEIKAVIEESVL
jgi:hypothetical protein